MKNEERYCADCGEKIINNNYEIDAYGNTICSECLDENYFICNYCGDLYNYSEEYVTDNGDSICSGCVEDYNEEWDIDE